MHSIYNQRDILYINIFNKVLTRMCSIYIKYNKRILQNQLLLFPNFIKLEYKNFLKKKKKKKMKLC